MLGGDIVKWDTPLMMNGAFISAGCPPAIPLIYLPICPSPKLLDYPTCPDPPPSYYYP